MHSQENWDHLRYVLAVADTGSVSKAAKQLGVNHATVLRHVAAFEANIGTEVFEKSPTGYTVLRERLRVIEAAKEVETAMHAVRQVANGALVPVRGLLRVTSTDSLCLTILPGIIAKWQEQQKELRIELFSTNAHLNLGRLSADITVRPALRLDDELRGVVAGRLGMAAYGAIGKTTQRWLALGGALSRIAAADWVSMQADGGDIAGSADSFMALRELVAAGVGQSLLPCVVGDSDPRLERRSERIDGVGVDIWVASHEELFDVPRIVTVRKMLIAALAEHASTLAGETTAND